MHIIQEEIGIPHLSEKVISENVSEFTVSPLPSGFGFTLGNALRRTLLSSVPGAGIVAVKIKGSAHEYSTLSGVSDSVLDLILSLKRISFKKISSDAVVLKLSKKGKGAVKASDIELSSDVEILNPDYEITYLDKDSTTLDLEIKVSKGVGFLAAKDKRGQEGPEWILVDTIFSPLKKVKYDVLSTRVGERTNLDKLLLEVETNGAIAPSEAVKFSSQLLQNYFEFFQKNKDEILDSDFLADFSRTSAIGDMGGDDGVRESYTPIEILSLSQRTSNALINGNIGSIEEVIKCSPSQLEGMRGFGKKAMTELAEALEKQGYSLKDES